MAPRMVRRGQVGRQPEQDGGVEHADAARQAGGQARGVGGDVDAEEDREGQHRVGAVRGGSSV